VDGVLVLAVLGLALALVAALVALRRRAEALDEVLAMRAAEARPAPAEVGELAEIEMVASLDESLPVGLVHVEDGRVDRANARAHALLGVAQGRLLGRTVMEAFLDPRVEALLGAAVPGGTATGEVRLGGGDPRTAVVRIQRRGRGTWIVLEDVTELRRLQQIRAEFIDNLSHELRTPLSTVSLLAETLARDAERAEVPPRMKERIAKIEVETGHLVQMVSELLDLARIEGGTSLALADDVDLGRLAAASVERLRLFADRQGVSLVVDAGDGVPPVRGDEERLGQVVVNLVHNAVKFSPNGGEVRVTVRAEGADVVVSVGDHGIGISRADRARIFERFYKADRARVRGGGTGLGLSIARHVVEGHGGRIWVESVEGTGSTFSFAIPAATDAAAGLPRPAASVTD
jgi:two-component system phosphate regulon sensor histidine kinase PhoR